MGNSCVLWWFLFFMMIYVVYESFWSEDLSTDDSSFSDEYAYE